MGQGEAAAGALAGGLAEVLAELKDAWHRAAAAVHDEDPMPAPGAGVIGHGVHRVGDAAEQCLEQGQGEPGAGLTVGRGSELRAAEAWQVVDRGVAVEDEGLEQE